MRFTQLQFLDSTFVRYENGGFCRYNTRYSPSTCELECTRGSKALTIRFQEPQFDKAILPGSEVLKGPVYVQSAGEEGAFFDANSIQTLVVLDGDPQQQLPERELGEIALEYDPLLVLITPLTKVLEYCLANNKSDIFRDNQFCDFLDVKLSKSFIEQHKDAIHSFMRSNITEKAKMYLFRFVCHMPEFQMYPQAKAFRTFTMERFDPNDLRKLCLYITSSNQSEIAEPFDRAAVKSIVLKYVQTYTTWVVEEVELRGLLGIISSYLEITPFDRLNGNFDNDRIVLYTYLIMNNDVQLFTNLVENRVYLFLSLLNDLPGFGRYFTQKDQGLSFAELKAYLSSEIGSIINLKVRAADRLETGEFIQRYTYDGLQQFPYIRVVYDTVKRFTLKPELPNLRTTVKLIDAMLHSLHTKSLYKFAQICAVHWLNYIYDIMLVREEMDIKDALRVSGSVLSLFQEFVCLQDNGMTQLITAFIYAVYSLAQKRIFIKKAFSIKDKTLPLEFEGNQAVFVYLNDKYEVRSMRDLHILAEPGQFCVYSSEQLFHMRAGGDSKEASKTAVINRGRTGSHKAPTPNQDGRCEFCTESLARIVRQILQLSPEDESYYFDHQIVERPCPICSGRAYFSNNEEEIRQIVLKQPVQSMLTEFPDESMYSNYITHFLDIDKAIEQLSPVTGGIAIDKAVQDIRDNRKITQRLQNVDGSIIRGLNDIQEIVHSLQSSTDTLDFRRVEDLIKYKVDMEVAAQQYDAFNLENAVSNAKSSTDRLKCASYEELVHNQGRLLGNLKRVQNIVRYMGNEQEKLMPLRVHVLSTLHMEACILTILRVWLRSSCNIKSILLGTLPEMSQDPYIVFYKNEQIFGRPVGLPSQLSIFKNVLPSVRYQCQVFPQVEVMLNLQAKCRQQFNYYQTTLDYEGLQKYQSQFGNDMLMQMLLRTIKVLPLEYLSKIHAMGFYQNTVCRILHSLNLQDQGPMQQQIKEILQTAIIDYSEEPFSSNWFVDSHKGERNQKVNRETGTVIDIRTPSWPEQFELDLSQESFTEHGLSYIPAYLRYLNQFRTLAFGDDKIQLVKSVFYQFVQFSLLSKVTVVKRYNTTRASLQGLTVKAIIHEPQLLRSMLLKKSENGSLAVKHLSMDTLVILLNNGELSLICEWLDATYDNLLRYLEQQRVQPHQSYKEFVSDLLQGCPKRIQKQFYIQQKLPEYYFNVMIQVIMCVNLLFGALQESNSTMVVPVLMKIARVNTNMTGDAMYCQLQARAIIQLKILLQMELTVRTGRTIEQIQFNSRRLIPLISHYHASFNILISLDAKLLYSKSLYIDNSSLLAQLGFNKQATIDFTRLALSNSGILIPQVLTGQCYDGQGPIDMCQVIIDQASFESKQRRVQAIIADHQMYIYYGKSLELFVGCVSLVKATVGLIDTPRRDKLVAITCSFPRRRTYLVRCDEPESFYLGLVSAIL